MTTTPCDKPAQPYNDDPNWDINVWNGTTAEPGTARPVGWARPPVDPGHTFWMVYVDGRETPAVRHYDYNEALAEADRLAHKEVGRPVYILPAVRYCRVEQAPVVWHECKSRP